jgi:Txe/YoeB family toxin of toxin-antitoxin system
VNWTLVFTAQAKKDAKKLASSGLKAQAQPVLDLLTTDPYQTPPRYEKLVGELAGAYSRRINIQHRLVYQVPTTNDPTGTRGRTLSRTAPRA